MTAEPLRLGILGAARIAPMALITPARRVGGRDGAGGRRARCGARAALRHAPRHPARARDATRRCWPIPEIEAVYNPLPNSLHADVDDPRARGREARAVREAVRRRRGRRPRRWRDAAARTGRVLMEAFHYRYHRALRAHARASLRAGELGPVRHLEAHLLHPDPAPGRHPLARRSGGRRAHGRGLLHDAPPAPSRRGRARGRVRACRLDAGRGRPLDRPPICVFPAVATARLTCALLSATFAPDQRPGESATRATLRVLNCDRTAVLPPPADRDADRHARRAREGRGELRRAAARLRRRGPRRRRRSRPTPADAIANMRAIDAVYARPGGPAIRGSACRRRGRRARPRRAAARRSGSRARAPARG